MLSQFNLVYFTGHVLNHIIRLSLVDPPHQQAHHEQATHLVQTQRQAQHRKHKHMLSDRLLHHRRTPTRENIRRVVSDRAQTRRRLATRLGHFVMRPVSQLRRDIRT